MQSFLLTGSLSKNAKMKDKENVKTMPVISKTYVKMRLHIDLSFWRAYLGLINQRKLFEKKQQRWNDVTTEPLVNAGHQSSL